jgi:hypothetical protein
MLVPGSRLLRSLPVMTVVAGCGVSPEDCVFFNEHFSQEPPIAVGEGLVSSYHSPGGWSPGSFVYIYRTVIDCASNEELTIIYVSDDTPGTPDGIYGGEAASRFEEGFVVRQYESLDEIRQLAAEAGLQTQIRNLEDEDCACAAFFPELRGDKPRYES